MRREPPASQQPVKGSRVSRADFLRIVGSAAVMGPAVASAAEPSSARPHLSIGVLTDCQYADIDTVPPTAKRLYRRSPQKLADALDHLGSMGDLDFMIHLGDAIDQGASSYRVVMPLFRAASVPVHHVAGNHDYSVAPHLRSRVPQYLGMPAPHYSFTRSGWRFIFLDGNALSTFAWNAGSPEHAAATAFLKASSRKLAEYSGGLGTAQLDWLRAELTAAAAAGERAILCCHYPLLPLDGHSLWDTEAVLGVIGEHRKTVAAWFCGHNHDGGFAQHEGVPLVNFRGMVDTPDNSYARADFYSDRIELTGFGREPSRVLALPAA